MRVHRPGVGAGLAVTLALVVVGSGCTSSHGRADPRPAARRAPLVYVALGGDDVYRSRGSFTDSWPQVLFRTHLPLDSTFVNLASPRDGAAEIRRDQVPTAVRLRPDVATVTVSDDLERGTDRAVVQTQLGDVIRDLRRIDGIRVLVGTAPPGTAAAAAVATFNALVASTARANGAELVDLGSVRAADPEARAQQIADAFDRAINRS